MTMKIVCKESPHIALYEAEQLEKEGFVPIGICGVPKIYLQGKQSASGTCILMYKKK